MLSLSTWVKKLNIKMENKIKNVCRPIKNKINKTSNKIYNYIVCFIFAHILGWLHYGTTVSAAFVADIGSWLKTVGGV